MTPDNPVSTELLDEIAGFDCREYDKNLSPEPCGKCRSCLARQLVEARLKLAEVRGTPVHRFLTTMDELEKRFPDPEPFSAQAPEVRYFAAIDAMRAKLAEVEREIALLYKRNTHWHQNDIDAAKWRGLELAEKMKPLPEAESASKGTPDAEGKCTNTGVPVAFCTCHLCVK